MSVFSFIKGIFFKKKVDLTQLPEKPGFEEPLQQSNLGSLLPIQESGNSQEYELIKAKLDLINIKIDNLDRKVSDLGTVEKNE